MTAHYNNIIKKDRVVLTEAYSAHMSIELTKSQTSSTDHADRRARASAHKHSLLRSSGQMIYS